jgi:hypothetical protein
VHADEVRSLLQECPEVTGPGRLSALPADELGIGLLAHEVDSRTIGD